jgi:hypothetical protein
MIPGNKEHEIIREDKNEQGFYESSYTKVATNNSARRNESQLNQGGAPGSTCSWFLKLNFNILYNVKKFR